MTTSKENTAALVAHIVAENARLREWASAGPGRVVGTSIEDPDFWANRDVFTVEDYQLYFARSEYSDYHKEVHGFRPSNWSEVKKMTLDELDAEMEYLNCVYVSNRAYYKREAEWAAEMEEQETMNRAIADGDFSLINDAHREEFVTEQLPLGSIALSI